jgi:alkylhydroperoxidase family enzyme
MSRIPTPATIEATPAASQPLRGHVSEDDIRAVKSAGYDDAQVIEIVLHVVLTTWTNYINVAAQTDIDFPVVTARKAA